MFCPKCKCEYREGFTKCSDCNVLLVNTLPVDEIEKTLEEKTEYIDYELILSTFKFSDIAQIESVFDGEDIIYYIQGENLGVAPGGLPANVFVNIEQMDEARQLLKDFNLL